MKRAECIAMLYPELEDKLVVTIMGACAQELYDLGHKENFFYLQHAMGLASSIGLGLALHLPQERSRAIGRRTSSTSSSTTAACSRPVDSTRIRPLASPTSRRWPGAPGFRASAR
jgi:hypothetical protein